MRKIFDPLYQGVTKKNKACINGEIARKLVIDRAQEYRNYIKNSIKNKLISIQLDCCTRLSRSFLGVNLSFLGTNINDENETYIITLGVIEVTKQHTAVNLKKEIVKLLKTFGVDLKQILTITTDNGLNVLKSTKLIDEDLRNEIEHENAGKPKESVVVAGPSSEEKDDGFDVTDYIVEVEEMLEPLDLTNDEEDDVVLNSNFSNSIFGESSTASSSASTELFSSSNRIVECLLGAWNMNEKIMIHSK